MATFIIDCPRCKAKVAAEHKGELDTSFWDDDAGEPVGHRILLGKCPSCTSSLVGRAEQIGFQGYEDWEVNVFGDVVRIYPDPPKVFTSGRIPRALTQSLLEAERCLQTSAYIAACVMLGRALEALCRDVLEPKPDKSKAASDKIEMPAKPKRMMLGNGIRELRERKIIDDRLYDWSVSLQAMRNLAAHPVDITVSRDDAEDLQVFVNAITEYVYDLTDRYEEFKGRELEGKKPRRTIAEMFGGVAGIVPGQPEKK